MLGTTDPRKVVLRLLEALFDQRTLAQSSALGSRSAVNRKGETATTAIPFEVKAGIKAYVLRHCGQREEVHKCLKELNSIINSKCGTARRYIK